MLTLIWCLFYPRVNAVARKRPRPFYRKYRWRVTPKHVCTRDSTKSEWAEYAAVQAQCGNSHATRQGALGQSSQLAEPLWTDPGLKSGISVRKLISTKKQTNKQTQAGNELSNILPKILAREEKATTTTTATKVSFFFFS